MNGGDYSDNKDTIPNGNGINGPVKNNCNKEQPSNNDSDMLSIGTHNDCNKQIQTNGGQSYMGARPKIPVMTCNITHGVSKSQTYDIKLNNNNLDVGDKHFCNGHGVDLLIRNNVDEYSSKIDKCPPKVKKESDEENDCVSRICMKENCNGSTETRSHKKVRNEREKENENVSRFKRDDDSFSENEEDDDYYIYTYKGDQNQMADLPSSFFRLGAVPHGRADNNGRNSPDMDYLEMDFDPGPSNNVSDSSDDSDHLEIQHEKELCNGRDTVSFLRETSPQSNHQPENIVPNLTEDNTNASQQNQNITVEDNLEDNSNSSNCVINKVKEDEEISNLGPITLDRPRNNLNKFNLSLEPVPSTSYAADIPSTSNICEVTLPSPKISRDTWGYHCTSGDLCSPGDLSENNSEWLETNRELLNGDPSTSVIDSGNYNLRSALYHCIMAKRLVLDKQSFTDGDQQDNGSGELNERTMIWSEQEACIKQVTQIGTSQCGVTAIINVLLALNIQFSREKLKEAVSTRFRNENASVPDYLFSRSIAGAAHEDLIGGVEIISQGSLYAKFFHMYPPRNFSLSRWLALWMKRGAIPIATINLQRGIKPEGQIPDVWHHQMIFGTGPRGIYLTNPLECIPEQDLMVQLCSPSVLKIRRTDILSRWTCSTDLTPLIKHPDVRWKRLNVLGQVVNIIHEAQSSRIPNYCRTTHITIPACYSSGITLVIPKENPSYSLLKVEPQLSIRTT